MVFRHLALSALSLTALSAATYHCDPAKGAIDNPGTESKPWPAIEEVIAKGLLPNGSQPAIKAGDTILLHT